MDATNPTRPGNPISKIEIVTLSRDDLNQMLEQAASRGAELALSKQHGDSLGMAEAAAYIYGRSDRVEAFRALRLRYPAIDALSTGHGRFRRWQREALDKFLANRPRFQPRAKARPIEDQSA